MITASPSPVALLAPVPYEHLPSALERVAEVGKVAFGSRAWEVFRDLDSASGGLPAPVLIYASHNGAAFPPVATWSATYLGHVEGRAGRHPGGLKYRPETTEKYESDNFGHWAVFWEVSEMKHLEQGNGVPISSLISHSSGKAFAHSFRPEGPILIQNSFAI